MRQLNKSSGCWKEFLRAADAFGRLGTRGSEEGGHRDIAKPPLAHIDELVC